MYEAEYTKSVLASVSFGGFGSQVCVGLPKESKPSLEKGIETALHSKRDSLPHVVCVRYARLILLTEALGRSPGSFVF